MLQFIWKSRSQKSKEEQNPSWSSSIVFIVMMSWEAMSSAGVGFTVFYKVSTACIPLLTGFMDILVSFSSRTWYLPMLPEVPIPALTTNVLLFLTGDQTGLT
ncbi:hypothetical protein AMECASPLE_035915 [Ameca splendens]|uniref:Uncharacterized protein n=1 Tax=Ameca splendens TaxID=208324 RepID=A0ABV0YJJ0_9TELE